MKITMDNTRINSIEDMRDFLQTSEKVSFEISSQEDKYQFISNILIKFKYKKLRKKDKGVLKKYIIKVTGYSKIQTKRLIKKWSKSGLKSIGRKKNKGSFKRIYKPEDIALLIKTDVAHMTVNGNATKKALEREYKTFNRGGYKNISNISVSHIYNIRNNSNQYLTSEAIKYSKTNPVSVNIGERKKPQPYGKPGFLRIDSVHQGDKNGEKGV